MAPHALTDLSDTSGYYPSTPNKAWSQTLAYHKSLKLPPSKPALSAKTPFGNFGFGSESPKNVWSLSSDEVDAIEKNVRDFISILRQSPSRTESERPSRLEFTAQCNQSNNIPPDVRAKIKVESHIGKCLRRTAILHSFWIGSLSIL